MSDEERMKAFEAWCDFVLGAEKMLREQLADYTKAQQDGPRTEWGGISLDGIDPAIDVFSKRSLELLIEDTVGQLMVTEHIKKKRAAKEAVNG